MSNIIIISILYARYAFTETEQSGTFSFLLQTLGAGVRMGIVGVKWAPILEKNERKPPPILSSFTTMTLVKGVTCYDYSFKKI